MLSNVASLIPFGPEIVLSAGMIVVLAVGMILPRSSRHLALALTLVTLAATAAVAARTAEPTPRALFGGLLARDPFADFFKLLFVAAGAIVALASVRARDVIDRDRDASELGALLLAVVLGASLMAAATDLLTAYLSLEFVSILSYVLTGFSHGSRRSAEAALKYAIYGGVATGAMLYGFSLLYGLAGSTDLAAIRAAAANAHPLMIAVAVTLCMAGFGFKMAVVPFHMWCPDVYEGAPTPIAAFFSIVPKAAGFALAYRLVVGGTQNLSGHLPGSLSGNLSVTLSGSFPAARLLADGGAAAPWALVVMALSAVTMTLGNLAALAQRNVKRLLAYSSIAHAGTILMAFSVGTDAGSRAMLVYLGIYLFMNLTAFLVVIAVAERRVGESLEDFAGLATRSPLAAFCLAVALFSLTGLPPTGGFVAKYAVFAAVIQRGVDGGGRPFFLLALCGVLNTVVSLYYYARVVRVMYLDRVARPGPAVRLAGVHIGLLVATTAPVVMLGLYVTPLSTFVARSIELWAGR